MRNGILGRLSVSPVLRRLTGLFTLAVMAALSPLDPGTGQLVAQAQSDPHALHISELEKQLKDVDQVLRSFNSFPIDDPNQIIIVTEETENEPEFYSVTLKRLTNTVIMEKLTGRIPNASKALRALLLASSRLKSQLRNERTSLIGQRNSLVHRISALKAEAVFAASPSSPQPHARLVGPCDLTGTWTFPGDGSKFDVQSGGGSFSWTLVPEPSRKTETGSGSVTSTGRIAMSWSGTKHGSGKATGQADCSPNHPIAQTISWSNGATWIRVE